MEFIITRHEPSRNRLLEDLSTLEKITNTESKLKGFAMRILNNLGKDYSPPISKQYVFKPKAEYNFYQTFREIIGTAKNYITLYCNMSNINEIRILTHFNLKDLRIVKNVFDKQYSHINLEIRSTDKYHDRYLFFDNEQWVLGPSVKDGGTKATTIVQLKNNAATDAISVFNGIWDSEMAI